MSSEGGGKDADGNSRQPSNERRPGLRSGTKLKPRGRNHETVRPNATNVIQAQIEEKKRAFQKNMEEAESVAQNPKLPKATLATTRYQAHLRRATATALYKDYLYYQTPQHRKQYCEDIDAAVKARAKQSFERGHPPAKLSDDKAYDRKLKPLIKRFEDNDVSPSVLGRTV